MTDAKCMICGRAIPEERHICLSCEGQNETQCFVTPEPKTNADKIRQMMDEELAKFLKEELIHSLMYDRKQYEKGFNDGMQAVLLKIAECANAKEAEICLLHCMGWEDDGCCIDCVECVRNHCENKTRGSEYDKNE